MAEFNRWYTTCYQSAIACE